LEGAMVDGRKEPASRTFGNVAMGLLAIVTLVMVIWGSCSVRRVADSVARIAKAVESVERKVVTGR